MLPAIGSMIGAVVGLIKNVTGSYFERKKIEAQGKIEIAKIKVKGEIERAERQDVYDSKAVDEMRYSFKDELLTIVFAGVFVASFLPWTQEYVKQGFIFLDEYTPDWYQWCFMGIVAASFGLKSWLTFKNGRK